MTRGAFWISGLVRSAASSLCSVRPGRRNQRPRPRRPLSKVIDINESKVVEIREGRGAHVRNVTLSSGRPFQLMQGSTITHALARRRHPVHQMSVGRWIISRRGERLNEKTALSFKDSPRKPLGRLPNQGEQAMSRCRTFL